MPLDKITVNHIHDLLKEIWKDKTETANRVWGRIEKVQDYAILKLMMQSPNPATWQGSLSVRLPSKANMKKKRTTLPARRWWSKLVAKDGQGRKALIMLTLTVPHSWEIRGMHWGEIHLFDADRIDERGFCGIWTIPAHRMKTKAERRVPITSPMRELLEATEAREGLVFPAASGRMLSDMTLSALMKSIHQSKGGHFVDQHSQRQAVPHGLRSTFRDWGAEHGKSREAAELQLAHKFGSAVEHV